MVIKRMAATSRSKIITSRQTKVPSRLLTYQLDDLNENPVVSGRSHEFEEEWCQRQIVLGISPSQLTDNVNRCRLDT